MVKRTVDVDAGEAEAVCANIRTMPGSNVANEQKTERLSRTKLVVGFVALRVTEAHDARRLARKGTATNIQRASKAANEAPYSVKTNNSE